MHNFLRGHAHRLPKNGVIRLIENAMDVTLSSLMAWDKALPCCSNASQRNTPTHM